MSRDGEKQVRRPRRRLYQAPAEATPDQGTEEAQRKRTRRRSVKAETAQTDDRERRARQAIEGSVFNAVALAAVPVPLFDVLAVTLVQVRLVERLCRIYEQPYSRKRIKAWLAALTSGVVSVHAGLGVFRGLARIIPGPGTLLGLAAIPTFSGAATQAVGVVFHDHLRAGGNSLCFDVKAAQAHFKTQLQKGKEVVVNASSHFTSGTQA